MSRLPRNADHLGELVGAVCSKGASQDDFAELNTLLLADEAARSFYLRYCQVHVAMRLELRAERAAQKICRHIGSEPPIREVGEYDLASDRAEPGEQPSPHPVFDLSSAPGHGIVTYLAGWPAAYLVATVIFAIGLVAAALVHVSQPLHLVTPSSPLPSPLTPLPAAVARITGMVDCEWEGTGFGVQGSGAANHRSEIINHDSVIRLGDRLALKSGLLELTYDTGAKVILQGPVRYEIESPAGGYLAVGKLTAKLEKKVGSGQWPVVSDRKSSSPKSLAPSPSSNPQSLIPNPLFAIRTPTALVTDLGTEFGVEVDKQGSTTSHVFRGLVRVQRLFADGTAKDAGQVLHEDQSARVANDDTNEITVVQIAKPSDFARELPQRTPRLLDLVDVVAGGDGFSGRRNRGIDPTTGRLTDTPGKTLLVDDKYHRVGALPFVDGVFIPDGRTGRVQIDSAGHSFGGFPATAFETGGCVWAGGVIPLYSGGVLQGMMPTELGGTNYSSAGHGVVLLHANKGITFDLEAIRKANPDHRLTRFLATAGNTGPFIGNQDTTPKADLWVFVDGKVRFQRQEINGSHAASWIRIPLHDNNRFLTLATTDGGDGISGDWTMFGDPRLELAPATKSDVMSPQNSQ